jgi:hypothetical protein
MSSFAVSFEVLFLLVTIMSLVIALYGSRDGR